MVQPGSDENFMGKMFSERELLGSQVVGQEAADQVSFLSRKFILHSDSVSLLH